MLEITRIEAPDGVWYYPDIQDNRKLPEEERFALLIVPMTAKQMRLFNENRALVSNYEAGNEKEIKWLEKAHSIRDDILCKCVKEVKNCRVRKIVKSKVELVNINSAEQLTIEIDDLILDKIHDAIKDHSILEEGLKKTSERLSDSPISLPSPRSSGGVRAVTPPSKKIIREVKTRVSI